MNKFMLTRGLWLSVGVVVVLLLALVGMLLGTVDNAPLPTYVPTAQLTATPRPILDPTPTGLPTIKPPTVDWGGEF